MGYSKSTSKAATALDYAQIDHYKRSTVAGLLGQTIDPLDMSVENISQFANRNLDKGVSSKGYNFHSSNTGTNYALELGLPEISSQNTIHNIPQAVKKELLTEFLELKIGEKASGKATKVKILKRLLICKKKKAFLKSGLLFFKTAALGS